MQTHEKNHLANISLLRTFAILVVVLGHSMIVYQNSWRIFTPAINSELFNYLKNYIDTFQMPLFIFISGYVYYYCKKECRKYNDIKKYILAKFNRLIIPYFCVALFYVIPIRLFVQYKGYKGESLISIIIKYIITGKDSGNLWYVYALFFIMVAFFLSEKVINKLPMSINLLIFSALSVIGIKLPVTFQLSNISHYFVFFYLGYVFRSIELNNIHKVLKHSNKVLIGTSALLIFEVLLMFIYFKLGSDGSTLLKLFRSLIYFFSQAFGALFYYVTITILVYKYKLSCNNKTIKYIDKESFAIYLFHSPLVYIILYFIAGKNLSPFIVVPTIFIVILFGSLGISYVIQKTQLLRFVIGSPIIKKSNTFFS